MHVGPTTSEAESQRLRRSLFVVKDVRAGEEITAENVRSIRPAGGLEPRYLDVVLGRTFAKDVERGTPLSWDLV
ncbi:SAF domain-containing protein [Brachybacterium sp. GPGPB12]|uniref:SAF domain-containing protein n=1 Tax=Brachybacterium sp. GPGPB12 TaxID=3023517 RepID=UPI0031344929